MPLRSTLSCDFVRLSLLSYRHPERKRGIFVAAVFLIHTLIRFHETPYPTFLAYQASRFGLHAYTVLPQTKKISRFRSKWRYGKAVFLHRFLLTRGRIWCGDTVLPPSYGRRCPEGAEVGSRSGIKRNGEGAFSHITFPSTAEGAFFVYRSLFPSRMKRRDLGAYGVPCFPFSDARPFLS